MRAAARSCARSRLPRCMSSARSTMSARSNGWKIKCANSRPTLIAGARDKGAALAPSDTYRSALTGSLRPLEQLLEVIHGKPDEHETECEPKEGNQLTRRDLDRGVDQRCRRRKSARR